MTSKVYNKGNNRPLDTMDEVAYHELKSKYKNLEEKLGAYKKQIGGSHYKDMKVQPAQFINDNKLLLQKEMLLNISAGTNIKEKYKIWKKQNTTLI